MSAFTALYISSVQKRSFIIEVIVVMILLLFGMYRSIKHTDNVHSAREVQI